MKRRSFFGMLGAVLLAPFVAKAASKAPVTDGGVMYPRMQAAMREIARTNFHDDLRSTTYEYAPDGSVTVHRDRSIGEEIAELTDARLTP